MSDAPGTVPKAVVDACFQASHSARDMGEELLLARRGQPAHRLYNYRLALQHFDELARAMGEIRRQIADISPPGIAR